VSDADQTDLPTDGRGLRAKLEETLGENKQLRTQMRGLLADKVITSKGFDLVTVNDLAGVDLDKIETEAARLQTERTEQYRTFAESRFKAQGLQGDALTKAVDEFVKGSPGQAGGAPVDAGAYERARGVGGGTPTPQYSGEGLSASAKLRAGLEQASKRRT
jgi:hypothetical protein